MLIRILIETTQPLAGTAATDEVGPLRFDGWLELLRVTSELIATATPGDDDESAAEEPRPGTQYHRFAPETTGIETIPPGEPPGAEKRR